MELRPSPVSHRKTRVSRAHGATLYPGVGTTRSSSITAALVPSSRQTPAPTRAGPAPRAATGRRGGPAGCAHGRSRTVTRLPVVVDSLTGSRYRAARRLGARVGCPRSGRSAQTARSRRRCPWSCRRPRRSRSRWSNRSTTTPPPARARPSSPPCPTPRRAARRGGRRALPRESPRQWRTRPIRSARLSSTSVAVVTALIRLTRGGAGESDLDVRPSSDRIAARHHNHARH